MFDTTVRFIEDQIKQFEIQSKNKEEVYLGVSKLDDASSAKLKELGWRATYVGQGFFQFSKN